MKLSGIRIFFICLLFVLFGYGLIRLFYLRFEQGDIFPPYSSLRSDPSGTLAFYESLRLIEAVRVERNYLPMHQLKTDEGTAVMFLGISSAMIYKMDFIYQQASAGGRIIIAFKSVLPRGTEFNTVNSEADADETETIISSAVRFGFIKELGVALSRGKLQGAAMYQDNERKLGLPPSLPWSSSLYFDKPVPVWRIMYSVNNHPVVMERNYGRGQIVLISDSYFFSNEALLLERFPEFLVWVIGDRQRILFDESHHGVYQAPGIAGLARKYRLHGLIFGIIVLSVLFIWKSVTPLVPPRKAHEPEPDYETTGGDNIQGMVYLLRRNIPPRQLIPVCIAEWEKTVQTTSAKKQQQINSLYADSKNSRDRTADPISIYNNIYQLIATRTEHHG